MIRGHSTSSGVRFCPSGREREVRTARPSGPTDPAVSVPSKSEVVRVGPRDTSRLTHGTCKWQKREVWSHSPSGLSAACVDTRARRRKSEHTQRPCHKKEFALQTYTVAHHNSALTLGISSTHSCTRSYTR